jgi:hypothetical protein
MPACVLIGLCSRSESLCSGGSERLQPPLAALEHRELCDPDVAEPFDCPLVLVAELFGQVGVARERHRPPRLQAQLEERSRRIDLADRLAQPRRRDLDRHVGLGDPVHGPLVEAPEIAFGQRHALAPDLDQVGMREHVEHAGARSLAQGLEVARPDTVGVVRAPDVIGVPVGHAAQVDCLVAQEVHRTHDVVPVAPVEQVRHAVLPARHEVGLDPEPEVGLLADEAAVLVEVVVRPAAPERVLPDLQRGGEAVHVLGDAQLGDPAFGGGLAVALRVGRREVLARGCVRLVRAQMDVVVGQHGGGL